MRDWASHPAHQKLLDELEQARTDYLNTRKIKVLAFLARHERALLGPYIVPRSIAERNELIEFGLVDVPQPQAAT